MIKNIRQYDTRFLKAIQKYGCYFLSLAHASRKYFEGEMGINALNGIWEKAIELGYISGDINKDGDLDDAGEAEIIYPDKVAGLLGLQVHYDDKHHAENEVIPYDVAVVIGQFYWKSSHFVLLNKHKEVTFDSMGYSNTVKNGRLKSMRWFYAD